ncbi:hypothetical protein [Micromonospora fluostatini]|uniref:hypothetical protein n=1 Tax=Micromonospora sp. JCM 30529 TaxID=3421643 RepID=UPI003D1691A5
MVAGIYPADVDVVTPTGATESWQAVVDARFPWRGWVAPEFGSAVFRIPGVVVASGAGR